MAKFLFLKNDKKSKERVLLTIDELRLFFEDFNELRFKTTISKFGPLGSSKGVFYKNDKNGLWRFIS